MRDERSALQEQFGGDHYRKRRIQPVEFWAANGLDAFMGSMLKYICRWRDKGGILDLNKALHFSALRMELGGAVEPPKVITISMNAFIKANEIPHAEEPILLALDGWFRIGLAGNKPCPEHDHFVKLLSGYIKENS